MTRVVLSVPLSEDVTLSIDRELDSFAVRIGDYHISLWDGVLSVRSGQQHTDAEVLRAPATLAIETPPF